MDLALNNLQKGWYAIKPNKPNQTLYKKHISHSILERGPQFVVSWEIDGETYTQRRDFFLSHIFFWKPGGTNACTPLESRIARDDLTPLIGCVSLARLLILCTLSKSDCMVITWSASVYTPVGPDCPDALSSPLFTNYNVTACQFTQGH